MNGTAVPSKRDDKTCKHVRSFFNPFSNMLLPRLCIMVTLYFRLISCLSLRNYLPPTQYRATFFWTTCDGTSKQIKRHWSFLPGRGKRKERKWHRRGCGGQTTTKGRSFWLTAPRMLATARPGLSAMVATRRPSLGWTLTTGFTKTGTASS